MESLDFHSTDLERTEEFLGNLRKALESRAVIGRATGIVMARYGLPADRAFEFLVHASQQRNVELAELARALVADPHGGHAPS